MARTLIEFRTGIGDPLAYAARWLRLANERAARVRVLAEAADLQALAHLLWVADKEGFLPHAFAGPAARKPGLSRTRLWLGEGEVAGEAPALLLNLASGMSGDVERYERVIEVVGAEEAQEQAGRKRWAAYKQLGLEPAHRAPDEAAVPVTRSPSVRA